VEYARLYQQIRPDIGAAVEEFCGGHMVFAGLNSPIGRATGGGFAVPITEADLDRLEAFYRAKNAPAQLDICPLHDLSLLEMVKARGYGIAELNNVLYRPLEAVEAVNSPVGVEIRPGQPEEAERFAKIVSRSFFEKGDEPEGFGDLMTPLFRFKSARTFVACLNGTPVAAAAGLLIPQHRVFALFGAGTLPEFRGRGIQTALLRTRMKAAADAGCEFVVVVTRGGTTSERNCVRLGFHIAYSKATVIKNVQTTGQSPL
jgi:ribosomal protein S18 acetylase RimI-like enzyme